MTIPLGDIKFDGPYPIINWDPPCRAAVYAIMIKPDPIKKPETFRIIYFGESSNLSERGFYKSHHKYQCWMQQARSESNIYIGIYKMPDLTQQQRSEIEQKLVNQYKPVCND